MDIVQFPASCLLVLLSLGVYTIVTTQAWTINDRKVQYSLSDVFYKREYWRIFTSAFSSPAIFHLLIAVTSFWGCRVAELHMGSFMFFHYSLVIIIANAGMKLLFLTLLRNNMRHLATLLTTGKHEMYFIALYYVIL